MDVYLKLSPDLATFKVGVGLYQISKTWQPPEKATTRQTHPQIGWRMGKECYVAEGEKKKKKKKWKKEKINSFHSGIYDSLPLSSPLSRVPKCANRGVGSSTVEPA